MNQPSGLAPCMLSTCVSCAGSVSCQEAARMAAEQADGLLRYTGVSRRLSLPVCLSRLTFFLPLFIFFLACAFSVLYACHLVPDYLASFSRSCQQVPDGFCLLTAVFQLLPQVLIKDSQHVEARGMWDVLRCGSSQVLFSDLTEVAVPSLRHLVITCVRS